MVFDVFLFQGGGAEAVKPRFFCRLAADDDAATVFGRACHVYLEAVISGIDACLAVDQGGIALQFAAAVVQRA